MTQPLPDNDTPEHKKIHSDPNSKDHSFKPAGEIYFPEQPVEADEIDDKPLPESEVERAEAVVPPAEEADINEPVEGRMSVIEESDVKPEDEDESAFSDKITP